MSEKRSLFFPTILIIIGSLLLLNQFNIDLSVLSPLVKYWPIFLILIGLSKIIGVKGLGDIFGVLLFIFLIMNFSLIIGLIDNSFESNETGFENYISNETISKINLDFDFGAGNIYIVGSNDIFSNNYTYEKKKPSFEYDYNNGELNIKSSRNKKSYFSFGSISEDWNIGFNNRIPTNIEMNFGATDVTLNLTNTIVKSIDLNFGASDVTIYLSGNEELVNLDFGLSDVDIYIPKGKKVDLNTDCGMASVNKKSLDYFKEDDKISGITKIHLSCGMADVNLKYY